MGIPAIILSRIGRTGLYNVEGNAIIRSVPVLAKEQETGKSHSVRQRNTL